VPVHGAGVGIGVDGITVADSRAAMVGSAFGPTNRFKLASR
jgi:hypothetical protein